MAVTGRRTKKLYNKVVGFLSSNYFFYGVLIVAGLQALWYALSFTPGLFDEPRHFENILIYSQHLSPFLGQQNPAWDHLGEVVRSGSFMFYYLLSWPLRFIRVFTQDRAIQIIGLRLVCTAFFLSGMVIYRRVLLDAAKASRAMVHLVLLLVVITPAVAPLPGVVNYDNLVFLLFAVLLLLAGRVVKGQQVNFLTLSWIVVIGLFMAVVKWTAIALVVPIFLYLIYCLYKKHHQRLLIYIIHSFKQTAQTPLIVTCIILAITIGLFIERPITNIIRYHGNAEPTCTQVLTRSRCEKFPDFVVYAQVDANRPAGFRPVDPANYFLTLWAPRMINTEVSLQPWQKTKLSSALPIISALYFTFAILGTAVILLYTREYWRDRSKQFLLFAMAGYVFLLFLFLYRSYILHAIPAAISARYLVPVLPIFILFVAMSSRRFFGRYRKSFVVFVCIILLLLTQGGSIITLSLSARDGLYWPNRATHSVNDKLQQFIRPLVKE